MVLRRSRSLKVAHKLLSALEHPHKSKCNLPKPVCIHQMPPRVKDEELLYEPPQSASDEEGDEDDEEEEEALHNGRSKGR